MMTITTNGFSALPYADNMKGQHKNGHNGHADAGFPERLVEVRKERGWTQQALCALVRCGIAQLKRYESGASQPTLDVIKRLAQALRVSSDYLLFGKDERGPNDDLRPQFEAEAGRFAVEGPQAVREAPCPWPRRSAPAG